MSSHGPYAVIRDPRPDYWLYEPIPLHGPAPRPHKGLRPAAQLEALAVQHAGTFGNRVGNGVRNLATEADLAALDEWMTAIGATSCEVGIRAAGLGGGSLWWQVLTPTRAYVVKARGGCVVSMGEQVWPSPRTKPDTSSHLPAGQFRGRLR